jgi:hypothetical protein
MTEATDMCGHPLETCIVMGDEADYFVSTGVARYITKEEAFAIVERSVKLGFMIESYYSKTTEVLCSCHASCCGARAFRYAGSEGSPYHSRAGVQHLAHRYDPR